jgi:hypothetical protein
VRIGLDAWAGLINFRSDALGIAETAMKGREQRPAPPPIPLEGLPPDIVTSMVELSFDRRELVRAFIKALSDGASYSLDDLERIRTFIREIKAGRR